VSDNTKNTPDTDAHDHITSEIERAVNEALSEAERIALDSKFSEDFRKNEVEELLGRRAREIAQTYKFDEVEYQLNRAELVEAADHTAVPSVEEATVLLYMKGLYEAKWATMTPPEILDGWRKAIADGDKTAIRVHADFARAHLRNVELSPGITADGMPPLTDLENESRAALIPDDKREARAALEALEHSANKQKAALQKAVTTLQSVRYDFKARQFRNPIQDEIARKFGVGSW
jgi:hypothetical protein